MVVLAGGYCGIVQPQQAWLSFCLLASHATRHTVVMLEEFNWDHVEKVDFKVSLQVLGAMMEKADSMQIHPVAAS